MERPGLKRLLADIEAGRVDVIVVYKVDRLTRALSDFAKIVEVLDARGASFVSVTQAFNTTTSMGRLTLNVLLSFAQFEREVTGERIRDKIAASKAKGMWMGGNPPLGYQVRDRKLVVVEEDAATVRHIFTRYLALGTGRALIDELREQGYRTKVLVQKGRTIGGIFFERGMLFAMLANRAYIGENVHRGVAYPGEHDAIVDRDTWDAVQQMIEANRVARRSGSNSVHPSLLAGIVVDGDGRSMTPSHCVKGGRRYRYYVTHASELTEDGAPASRLPAYDVEAAVVSRLQQLLRDKRWIASLAAKVDAGKITAALDIAEREASRLDIAVHRRSFVRTMVEQVAIDEQAISITINVAALAGRLGIAGDDHVVMRITAPAVKLRIGKATKLVISDADEMAIARDEGLVELLRDAQRAQAAVLASPGLSLKAVASVQKQCRTRFARLLRVSWLAPEIVSVILEGRHPRTLTPRRLLEADLPIAWDGQLRMLGIA